MEYAKPVKIPDGRYFLKLSKDGGRIFHQVNNVMIPETVTKDTRQLQLTMPSKTLFESIDNELVGQAEVQKLEWFGKELSDETIRSAYQTSLSPDSILSVSLATVKGATVSTFYDVDKKLIDEVSGNCDILIELAGLWFLKRSFGPIWRLVQIRQRPAQKSKVSKYPVDFQFVEEPEEEEDPTDYLD